MHGSSVQGDALTSDDRRRARSVACRLARVWLDDDYLLETGRALASLFPESVVAVYTRGADGRLDDGAQCHGPGGAAAVSCARSAEPGVCQPLCAAWQGPLRQPTSQYGCIVPRERCRADSEFRQAALAPYGQHYQLRMAAYDEENFVAYVGFLRPRRLGEYAVREQRIFEQVARRSSMVWR